MTLIVGMMILIVDSIIGGGSTTDLRGTLWDAHEQVYGLCEIFASIELKRMTGALSRRFSGLKCENGLQIQNWPKAWWKRGRFRGKMVSEKGQWVVNGGCVRTRYNLST